MAIFIFFFLVFIHIGCLNLGFFPFENTSQVPPYVWLISFAFFLLNFECFVLMFLARHPHAEPSWFPPPFASSSSINILLSLTLIVPTSYLAFECAFCSELVFSPFFIRNIVVEFPKKKPLECKKCSPTL